MSAEVGKRYVAPGGAEFIVTKGGPGTLSDGELALALKDATTPAPVAVARPDAPQVQLGKRFKSGDGAVELLVIKPGACDLRYNGEPMELLQPKVLPSAD
jgi:hypothetical protein